MVAAAARALVAVAVAAAVAAAAPSLGGQVPVGDAAPATSRATAAALNADPSLGWVADENAATFGGWSVGDLKGALRARRSAQARTPPQRTREEREAIRKAAGLPANFDSRKRWPDFIVPVENQGQCGSCWSFGTTKALSARFCIESKGAQKPVLTPQSLVSCDWEGNFGCNGGIPRLAYEYMEFAGVLTTDCAPYVSGDGKVPDCPAKCTNSSATYKKYYAKKFSASGLYDESEIMNEIYQNGPVTGTFSVYSDFPHYKSGVYVQAANATYLGGHAIDIVGWGTTTANPPQDYWIISNSWGPDWGLKGYFWFLRGTDQDGMEGDASCARAAL